MCTNLDDVDELEKKILVVEIAPLVQEVACYSWHPFCDWHGDVLDNGPGFQVAPAWPEFLNMGGEGHAWSFPMICRG